MFIETIIARLAPTRVTVLVDGGSSEERATVARSLHDRSPRGAQPFATIDCADAESEAVEQLLNGSASRSLACIPRLGTLYVANIDAMPLWQQPRFLGFLDGTPRSRVVVSARVPLDIAVQAGRFWPDLHERLFLVRIALTERT